MLRGYSEIAPSLRDYMGMQGDQTVVSPKLVCAKQTSYCLRYCSGPGPYFNCLFVEKVGYTMYRSAHD